MQFLRLHAAPYEHIGICCCFLGLLTSYGICSGLGLVFSPMHAIIPFLFVGIGIDDMFVIVQCHSNIASREAAKTMSPPPRACAGCGLPCDCCCSLQP